MANILYGICGIGRGHFSRQKSIIDELIKQGHSIIFFAFGQSLIELKKTYSHHPLIKAILEVNLHYYPSAPRGHGLDLVAAKKWAGESRIKEVVDEGAINLVEQIFPKIDLVISDYEPVSARVAMKWAVKIITIDQQSKFLAMRECEVNSFSFMDEVQRILLFFPKERGITRLAYSFFKIKKSECNEVQMMPGVIRREIREVGRERQSDAAAQRSEKECTIVYLGEQAKLEDIRFLAIAIEQLKQDGQREFTVYSSQGVFEEFLKYISKAKARVVFKSPSQQEFLTDLRFTDSVISTAGHNLVSECLYLRIPVFTLALDLYEQQLTSKVIIDYGLGGGCEIRGVRGQALEEFLANLEKYKKNIENCDILYSKEEVDTALGDTISIINDFLPR